MGAQKLRGQFDELGLASRALYRALEDDIVSD
jgi:hypothetical protein